MHGPGNQEVDMKVAPQIWTLRSLMSWSPKEEHFHQSKSPSNHNLLVLLADPIILYCTLSMVDYTIETLQSGIVHLLVLTLE